MPFLRLSRDKRGCEITSLLHTFGRRGKTRPRILYLFRTPPNVKVGRAALDEEAIRSIEENNPELTFDWTRILQRQAPVAETEEGRPAETRDRADESVAAERGRARRDASGSHDAGSRPTGQGGEAARRRERRKPDRDRTRPRHEAAGAAPDAQGQGIVRPGEGEPQLAPGELARLRARFAEVQARISERVTDPGRLEQLRREAERLNPDVWKTAADVGRGLREFESVCQGLRAAVGRRRRPRRDGPPRPRRRDGTAPGTPGRPSPPEEGPAEEAIGKEEQSGVAGGAEKSTNER